MLASTPNILEERKFLISFGKPVCRCFTGCFDFLLGTSSPHWSSGYDLRPSKGLGTLHYILIEVAGMPC